MKNKKEEVEIVMAIIVLSNLKILILFENITKIFIIKIVFYFFIIFLYF
jgi:hypothetical protein